MKKTIVIFILLNSIFFSVEYNLLFCETIKPETAENAAIYYGQLIFKKELSSLNHTLMYWPSGDPAVYVFTLMGNKDFYIHDPLYTNALFHGADLIRNGEENEGYKIIAQADLYITVYISADLKMSPLIKAHEGLSEHIIATALMNNNPIEPVWIYNGPFYLYVCSHYDYVQPNPIVTEIHTMEEISIENLRRLSRNRLNKEESAIKWERFMSGKFSHNSFSLPEKIRPIDSIEKILKVKEVATTPKKTVSTSAALVNCIKYMEEKDFMKLEKRYTVNRLMNLAEICFRTDPKTGKSKLGLVPFGLESIFKGLGYKTKIEQKIGTLVPWPGNREKYWNHYVKSIRNGYPCHFAGALFKNHDIKGTSTGIGYWGDFTYRYNPDLMLIVHDCWKETVKPVYIKYHGYGEEDRVYAYLHTFTVRKKKKYKKASISIKMPDKVKYNTRKNHWQWVVKLKSRKVESEIYEAYIIWSDEKGKEYYRVKERIFPYKEKVEITCPSPEFRNGKCSVSIRVVDDNGHLLNRANTVYLVKGPHIIVPKVKSFKINNGASTTDSRVVTLNNKCTGNPTHYQASEEYNCLGAKWKKYSKAPSFKLSSGYGKKEVFFKVKNARGAVSNVISNTIRYKGVKDPYEPNDTREEAYQISFSGTPPIWRSSGASIDPTLDADWFKFSASSGDKLSIGCVVTSSLDADIVLTYGFGVVAVVNDYGNGEDELLYYTCKKSGTYRVGIGCPQNDNYAYENIDKATTGTYTLTVKKTRGSGEVYREDFNDGLAQNWSDDGVRNWVVENGAYKSVRTDWGLHKSESIYTGKVFSDFIYSAKMRRTHTGEDEKGIIFRADSSLNNYYQFSTLSYAECFSIKKIENGVYTSEKSGTSSQIKNDTNWMTLKVIANGSLLKFYINDQKVYETYDNSFSSGKIGLFCTGDMMYYSGDYYFDDVYVETIY